MNRQNESLEVWLNDDLGTACQVGTLTTHCAGGY